MLFFLLPFCFSFLGAGTSSHPDSVDCVTDIIGQQCGQTSISINRAADYLEGSTVTGDIRRKHPCSSSKHYFRVFRNAFHRSVSLLARENGLPLQVTYQNEQKILAGLKFTVEK